MAKGQTVKDHKSTKVSKGSNKTKDEHKIIRPADANEQTGTDTTARVMGEREEKSRREETDAERIERRTNSVDSGEDDYADENIEEQEDQDRLQQDNLHQNNVKQDRLHKDANPYDDEDPAEGADYDENEERPHRDSR